MKKLSILFAVVLLCFAGQTFGAPYTYEKLNENGKPYTHDKLNEKTSLFKIKFHDDAKVRFTLTVKLEHWNFKKDELWYETADEVPTQVLITKKNKKHVVNADFYYYSANEIFKLYSTRDGRKFKVRKLENSIATPEPTTMLLVGMGLIGLASDSRKRRKRMFKRKNK